IKRRLDPSDQLNITVRPVGNARIEIILPTGGAHQAEAAARAWKDTLKEAADKWQPPEGKSYDDIPAGNLTALAGRIREDYPEVDEAERKHDPKSGLTDLGAFLANHRSDKRSVTSEEVEEFKDLIAQVGNLEFRILANQADDKDGIDAAIKEIDQARGDENQAEKKGGKKLSKLEEWALDGKPPPPPNGGKPFPNGYCYHWVELGKQELHSMNLNNSHEFDKSGYLQSVAQARAQQRTFPLSLGGSSGLLYSRDIPTTREKSKQDQDKK